MESATVELKIPCRAEYIGVSRLVILGVASRTPFSYDEVEDLRLAVGEACTSAIERATKAGVFDAEIRIVCRTEPDRIMIQVADTYVGSGADSADASTNRPAGSGESLEDQGIGALLMEILVDEIHTESHPGSGTVVSMVKYIGR